MKLKVKKLDPRAIIPTRAAHGDLGYDLYALEDTKLIPGKVTLIRTGIACNFPYGVGGILKDRSSVATKMEVFVKAGVIDQGYTGEIKVAMFNPGIIVSESVYTSGLELPTGQQTILSGVKEFKAGDKIAQMVLIEVMALQVEETDGLTVTERGDKGFGSSGR
jgi:dUTP pyrophosphatase